MFCLGLLFLSTANTAKAWTCGFALVDSRDSQSYSTVLIGAQCWMQQNINVGTLVLGSTTQGTSCASIEKYCYSNDEANCSTGGGLYQWNQAMCGLTTAGSQGICPLGWHIPTHDEFTTLERTVCTSGTCETDFPYNTTTTGWKGTNEGTTLKNLEGLFRVILSGTRSVGGLFADTGLGTGFWSSVGSSGYSWRRFLYFSNAAVNRYTGSNTNGFSVRCLADTKTITASAGTSGTITPTGTTTENYGETQTYTITPTNGYRVLDVLIDDVSQGEITSYTFTNITEDHTISATFEEIPKTSGSSVKGRVKNLIAMGKTTEAQELQNQFPKLFTPINQDYEGQTAPTSSQFRNLTLGSTGNDVKTLQIILNIMGYTISPSGFGSPSNESTYFGEKTKQALIKFQKENNITPAEGYFGSKTRDMLIIKLIKLLVS